MASRLTPLKLPALAPTDERRFWNYVQKGEACWPWLGHRRGGYGRLRIDGRSGKLYAAHRLAYFIKHRVDPGSLLVLHHCDNPRCCNPDHLFLGTDADNNADKERKKRGRHPSGSENGLATLTEEMILEIRASDETNTALANHFQVTDVTISNIRSGRTWKHVGGRLSHRPLGRPSRP